MDEPLTVLVADDDGGVRDLYECWLGDHDLRLAADGHEAIRAFDPSVDVVCLDREMPGPSGTDLAARLGGDATGRHVALVSSLPDDVDLGTAPVDQYVRKPVGRADIEGVIETCRAKREYLAAVDEYFALTARLGALEADGGAAGTERYAELKRRVAAKRAEVDEKLRRTGGDWASTFGAVRAADTGRQADSAGETGEAGEAGDGESVLPRAD